MTMIVVNINEAKARLSEYLEAVGRGERVVICKRNQPIAELRAVTAVRTEPRPLGGTLGVHVPPLFFEPLPDEIVDAFYGENPQQPGSSRVAERRPQYAKSSRQTRKRSR